MEIHYKTTSWVSMKFPDEITEKEILKLIEEVTDPLDLGNDMDIYYENISETESYMTVEENDGQPTIELMVDGKSGLECIWDNGKKLKKEYL